TPRSRLLLTALVLLASLTVRPPAAAFAEPRTGREAVGLARGARADAAVGYPSGAPAPGNMGG
ncbi:hypothetical protein, partial [Streptomyces sp. NPDC048192]|uniref:hypothetical protein n=1 Tax=Streptomyces sp. NPDC048192 TaxID=3365510 RepID=UPI0037164BC7